MPPPPTHTHPITGDRREGAEPRRRDCNAIAAQLKSAITHTQCTHLTGWTHAAVGAERRLHGAVTRERSEDSREERCCRRRHGMFVVSEDPERAAFHLFHYFCASLGSSFGLGFTWL